MYPEDGGDGGDEVVVTVCQEGGRWVVELWWVWWCTGLQEVRCQAQTEEHIGNGVAVWSSLDDLEVMGVGIENLGVGLECKI